MARSKKKYSYLNKEILRSYIKLKQKSSITLYTRNSIILPNFVGKRIFIYTGKVFKGINVVEDMVGLRVGELVFTRKTVIHGKQ
jgi:ribosomal protein S19